MNPIRQTERAARTAGRLPARSAAGPSVGLLIALAGCGGGDVSAAPRDAFDPPVEHAAMAAAADARPSASSDQLQLRIGGDHFSGTHALTGDFDCFAQPGVWGAGTTREVDQGISQFNLMLQGLPVTGGTSRQVDFTVVFGDMMDETSQSSGMIGLGAVAGGGGGTGTARRDGRGAVIEVNGTTHAGVKISAVLRCEALETIE